MCILMQLIHFVDLCIISVSIYPFMYIAVMELSTSCLLEQLSWHQKQLQAGRVIHEYMLLSYHYEIIETLVIIVSVSKRL